MKVETIRTFLLLEIQLYQFSYNNNNKKKSPSAGKRKYIYEQRVSVSRLLPLHTVSGLVNNDVSLINN